MFTDTMASCQDITNNTTVLTVKNKHAIIFNKERFELPAAI